MFIGLGLPAILFICFFVTIKKLDNQAMEMKNGYTPPNSTQNALRLNTDFVGGERFYIKVATAKGDTLMAFGDTGGGLSMLLPDVIARLGLKPFIKTGLLKGIMPVKYMLFDDIAPNNGMPGPAMLKNKIIRNPFRKVARPFFFIPPMDDELKFMVQSMPFDIFLGQNFFMGHAWTFDYINKEIWVNTPLPASEEGKPGVQRIGFKKNRSGESVYGHASMFIEVNGEIIEVLFDTGASMVLSEKGKKDFNTEEKTLGGSFIAASVFDKWRKEHPEWKYYEKADMSQDIIEVPLVKIGGYEVGPVLFAKRPDEAWSKNMINSMDKVVRGAIGGSALKYLKVTIDYNSELIKFEK